tara:strand:- start:205 stop:636 length:432 start_codon:yes stop_codon:yes gene_type:complete
MQNVISWQPYSLGIRKYKGESQGLVNHNREEYSNSKLDFGNDAGIKNIELKNKTVHVRLDNKHIPIGNEKRYSGPIMNGAADDIIIDTYKNKQTFVLYERIPYTDKARFYGRYRINRIEPTERVTSDNENVDTFLMLFLVPIS